MLVIVCAVTVVASFLRRPARNDLRWLSAGLILGVLGEAVIGAFVVYSNLNAYVVMTHFMVGVALLAVAVILTLEAGHGPGRGTLTVSRSALWLTRTLLALIVIVLAAGTATTGAGPHAGGKGAKRVPIGLEDMTRIHAEIVLTAGVVLLVLLWVLWRTNAPARAQDAGRVLLAVMVVQGIIGYTQFFTHLPALLVGIHVFGASVVWATALWFHHTLSDHPPEEPEELGGPDSDAVSGPDAQTAPGPGPDAVREPV